MCTFKIHVDEVSVRVTEAGSGMRNQGSGTRKMLDLGPTRLVIVSVARISILKE